MPEASGEGISGPGWNPDLSCPPHHVAKSKAGASRGLGFPLTEEGHYPSYVASVNLGNKGKVAPYQPGL